MHSLSWCVKVTQLWYACRTDNEGKDNMHSDRA